MAPRHPLSQMLLSALFLISALLGGVKAAPSSDALKDCVSQALKGSKIDIRIQTPKDDTWDDARIGAVVKDNKPTMVAFATDASEIVPLVKCAKKNNIRAVPRSGRHHFEAWSAPDDTLVIDMAHINHVKLNDDGSATIGAGAKLGNIYTVLSESGKTFPGGICPTVALGGYVGIGGYSVQQRTEGLAVDHLLSFTLVTAAGKLINVSPKENPDLWWAARGGGQYGIIVEITAKTTTFPRSAMASIQFPDPKTRYDAIRIFHHWAPKQAPELNSQFNLWNNRSSLYAWYLGGTKKQLQSALDESGLLKLPGVKASIDGDCSTENSRMFWIDGTNTCTDDATAYANFLQSYNTIQENLVPIEPGFAFDEVPADPKAPPADLWPRLPVISKTYFILKSKGISDESLKRLVDESGETSEDVGFWNEITTFNITAPPTTSSFPWQEDANILQRIEVQGEEHREWLSKFDKWYRPAVGPASYAGYIDSTIGDNTNPYTAYYGDDKNICRLIEVKKKYDPDDFFKNPFSIPLSPPKGIKC